MNHHYCDEPWRRQKNLRVGRKLRIPKVRENEWRGMEERKMGEGFHTGRHFFFHFNPCTLLIL